MQTIYTVRKIEFNLKNISLHSCVDGQTAQSDKKAMPGYCVLNDLKLREKVVSVVVITNNIFTLDTGVCVTN